MSTLLKVTPSANLAKESKVPFHMIGGKVNYRDLELVFPDFTVKTSGAVGLDGTLAIVAETPVPPAIAAAARLTPAQAKQTIRIPIGGTLEQPRLERPALESLGAIVGPLALENQLNRLLQPKR